MTASSQPKVPVDWTAIRNFSAAFAAEAEGAKRREARGEEKAAGKAAHGGKPFSQQLQFDGALSPLAWLSAEYCAKSILPTSIAALVRL